MIWRYLKRFFDRKKNKEVLNNGGNLSLEELEDWIKENTKDISQKFSLEANNEFLIIGEGIQDIGGGLKELERFIVPSELNERAKIMISQNKENYIRSSQRLLEFFKEGMKTERDVRKIEDFVKIALWEIDLFTRQTTKSFEVSSSIIGKEFEEILKGLKKINKAVLLLKTIDKSLEKTIESIKNNIDEIREDEKIKIKLNEIKEENNKKIKNFKNDLKSMKEKEERIRSSEEWKQKEELKNKILEKELSQERKRLEVRKLFIDIEKLLQKYAWNKKNKRVLSYIEDTISSLKEDVGLKILNDLDEIREDIEKDVYSSEKKKKEQFLERINKISERLLLDFLEEDLESDEVLKNLRKNEKEIIIENLYYDEIEDKIKDFLQENSKIIKKNEAISKEINSKKEKIIENIENLSEKIGKFIKIKSLK